MGSISIDPSGQTQDVTSKIFSAIPDTALPKAPSEKIEWEPDIEVHTERPLPSARVDAPPHLYRSPIIAALSPAEQTQTIARQILATATPLRDGTTEVALSPEELGRVRMTIATGDHGIIISIAADRPETHELMRRHVAELEQHFTDHGLSDVSFDFTPFSNGDRSPSDDGETARNQPDTHTPTGEAPQLAAPLRIVQAGLDLRL